MKTLTADLTMVHSGFCDRLKLLTFYIAIAHLRNINTIYIKERKTNDGPFLFVGNCVISDFEIKEWRDEDPETDLQIDYGFEPAVRPSLQFVKRNKPKDLKILDEYFLNIWILQYRKIGAIDNIYFNENDCLGLHIRMTDKAPKKIVDSVTPNVFTVKQINKINNMLQNKIKKSGFKKIYLASDDEKWRDFWNSKLLSQGYKVYYNNSRYNTSAWRQTNGPDFIQDLFSLAKCSQIVGTTSSGVPICASYINGNSSFSFAFDCLPITRLINRIRWELHWTYKMNLFDFHHSIIIRYILKLFRKII